MISVAWAGDLGLASLKHEALKVVPGNFQLVAEDMHEGVAFVAYQIDDTSYQFTLSYEIDNGFPDMKKLSYRGLKAFYFDPGLPSAGGIMVILKDGSRSLVVLYMGGFLSDEEVSEKNMIAILDKMNLQKLK